MYNIEEYIEDWSENKTLIHAGDLMSAAISNSQIDNPCVVEAALYTKEHSENATTAQLLLANNLTKTNKKYKEEKIVTKLDDISFDCIATPNDIYQQINKLRNQIKSFPYNPILYVEMARAYISIGLEEKAKYMMNIALHLSSDNRFITRAAARLYIHLNDFDQSHYILKKNQALKFDPWLIASEISVNLLRNRSSSNIKRGLEIIKSQNYHPFSITELSSSIGTIEFIHGANKKSRDLFNISLQSPNDNSLAQAEWALTHKLPIYIDREKFINIKCDYEAKALFSLQNLKYEEALIYTIDWIRDMQFTRRPIVLGSHIAYTHLKNYKIAAKILEIGLTSNPTDSLLLNNLAYTYALDNDINNAERCIESLDRLGEINVLPSTQLCITATKGLIAFRKKDIEKGRGLYQKAIDAAYLLAKESPTYYWKAVLNYIREELLSTSKFNEELLNELDKIKENPYDTEIKALKNDIIELNKQRLSGFRPHN
ncbi:hypothetical protein SDC9_40466 [bioreactor metagenome]|uniref:Beta-barrel assembly-enhancing protease n=1 Tax=bioreactor metagenome TaxID=1076179 RepID=A0A644VSE5_9ZZZZ